MRRWYPLAAMVGTALGVLVVFVVVWWQQRSGDAVDTIVLVGRDGYVRTLENITVDRGDIVRLRCRSGVVWMKDVRSTIWRRLGDVYRVAQFNEHGVHYARLIDRFMVKNNRAFDLCTHDRRNCYVVPECLADHEEVVIHAGSTTRMNICDSSHFSRSPVGSSRWQRKNSATHLARSSCSSRSP